MYWSERPWSKRFPLVAGAAVICAALTVGLLSRGSSGKRLLPPAPARTIAAVDPDIYGGEAPLLDQAPKSRASYRAHFGAGLPKEWHTQAGATLVLAGDHAIVRTASGRYDYSLTGPALELAPGRHQLVVRGEVMRGGLMLGLLDAKRDAWVKQSYFSQRQLSPKSDMLMPLEVRVTHAGRYQPILSNWSPIHRPSDWNLVSMDVISPVG